jgi:hypothetical protein
VAGEASGIRAGRAFVELAIHDLTEDGLNKAAARYKKFGRQVRDIGVAIGGFGAAIVGPLTAFATLSAKAGAEIYDMSKRTGIAVSTLSALGYAADQSGTDINTVEGALRRMQKSIAGVADEAEGTTGSLSELGIEASSIQGKNPAEQFNLVAAAIRRIPDATERAAAAQRVFGRSGTSLLPLIENFEKLNADAKKFGFIRTDASAKAAKEFEDELNNAAKAGKSLASALGAAVIPILKQQAIFIRDVTLALRDFAKEHQFAIGVVFQFGKVLVYVGSTLGGVGIAIIGIGSALKTLRTAVVLAVGAWQDLKTASAFLLANPVIALAAVAATFAVIYLAIKAASAASAELSHKFAEATTAAQQQRVITKGQIDRLAELANRQKLTSQEVDEARSLIAALTEKYGELGVSVNSATGQIAGFGTALAKVRQQETAAELQRLNQAINESKQNIRELKDETGRKAGARSVFDDAKDLVTTRSSDTGVKNLSAEENKKLRDEQAKLLELQLKRQRLTKLGGDVFDDADQKGGDKAAANAAKLADALKRETKAREDLEKAKHDSHEAAVGGDAKAIDDVNTKLKEELALIDDLREIARTKIEIAQKTNDQSATAKAKTDFEQLQRDRVEAARNAEAQIQRIQSQNAEAKIEGIGDQLDQKLRQLDVRRQAAHDRGDAGEVARIESQRAAVIRTAEDHIRTIRKASLNQQLTDARAATAAELATIDTLTEAAKARGDVAGEQRLQGQRVAVVRDATDKIAGILRQSAADQAADDEKRIDAIRQRLGSQVAGIDARKEVATDNGDRGSVGKLEQERVAAVENAEREIRELRKRSTDEQIAAVQDSTRAITQEIARQKSAALGSGNVREFQKLEQDRVSAVADAEQRIADVRKNAADRQAADDARRATDERRRQQEKVQKQQDATRFLLELQKELAEKQGGGKSAQSDTQKQQIAAARAAADEAERRRIAALKRGDSQGAAAALRDRDNAKQRASQLDATPAAKFLEKQLSSLEFEQRLTQLFGDNEAMKGRFRQLKAQIDAVPTIQHNAAGTFNAAAAQSLRGTPVEERTAKACEETARNTRDMTKKQPVYSR